MIIEHRSEPSTVAATRRGSAAERAWSHRSAAGSRKDWTLAVGSFLGLLGLIAGLQAFSAPSRSPLDPAVSPSAAPR